MRVDVGNEIKKYQREEVNLLNKSELARRMGCNRRTVTRYINSRDAVSKKRSYNSVLDDFKSITTDKVDTYGATAMAVYKFIRKKGYRGKYGTVANFVKEHKKLEQQKATIRFETTPGLQAQVDWKENVRMISKHGEIFEIQIFLMVLGYSRLKFLKVTVDKTQKTLFMCMFEAIRYFQGVPHEILFDNTENTWGRFYCIFSRRILLILSLLNTWGRFYCIFSRRILLILSLLTFVIHAIFLTDKPLKSLNSQIKSKGTSGASS